METRTYYDILGVSSKATSEEITGAKNALAKVYHPDANMDADIDTTFYMQEILEAYNTLSNPDKRREYDETLSQSSGRVFRTYTVENMEKEDYASFATYWNAACKLYDIVFQSRSLLEISYKKQCLLIKIFKKFIKKYKSETELTEQLHPLSMEAIEHIAVLKAGDISMDYWHPEAMNWVLVRWGQKQSMNYHVLFSKYEAYVKQNKSVQERSRLHSQSRRFQNSLKKLLQYASEC